MLAAPMGVEGNLNDVVLPMLQVPNHHFYLQSRYNWYLSSWLAIIGGAAKHW